MKQLVRIAASNYLYLITLAEKLILWQAKILIDHAVMSYEYISVKDIMLEKGIYKILSQMQYRSGRDETSIPSLINDMIKEYLHTYVLSKNMGHMLLSKDVVRTAIDSMSDEEIQVASDANAMRYKEGAIIEHGKPSLAAYLSMIRAFAKANKFEMEISKNPDNTNQVLIIGLRMGDKFSRLKANTYRKLLEEFAEIEKVEATGTAVYFEFKPKDGQVIRESVQK